MKSAWFSNEIKKRVYTEECRKENWLYKLIPNIINRGRNDIIQISLDEERHLIYTLNQRDFNDQDQIAPSEVDIYYLGAFGETFKKVTSISQSELQREYKKNKNSSNNIPLQIVGLHHINISESDDLHFLLITSAAQRIYFSLDVKDYDTEKMREYEEVNHMEYHKELPTGLWKIAGITNPPLPKDISSFNSNSLS